jgi:hypothetical protein
MWDLDDFIRIVAQVGNGLCLLDSVMRKFPKVS